MSNSIEEPKSFRQRLSILCTLDTIEPDERRFTILIDDGRVAQCVVVEGEIPPLGPFVGKRVMVGGIGVWHLTGRLDRIEVDRVRSGEGELDFWRFLHTPRRLSSLPPEEPTPLPINPASIIGKWPGDETDEQIEEALKRIS